MIRWQDKYKQEATEKSNKRAIEKKSKHVTDIVAIDHLKRDRDLFHHNGTQNVRALVMWYMSGFMRLYVLAAIAPVLFLDWQPQFLLVALGALVVIAIKKS